MTDRKKYMSICATTSKLMDKSARALKNDKIRYHGSKAIYKRLIKQRDKANELIGQWEDIFQDLENTKKEK